MYFAAEVGVARDHELGKGGLRVRNSAKSRYSHGESMASINAYTLTAAWLLRLQKNYILHHIAAGLCVQQLYHLAFRHVELVL